MSNWSSFKNDQLIMESWRSYNNEEPIVLNESTLDALKRIGAVVKGKLRDLESKGAAIKYAEDALKALQNDPAFKIDQAGTEAEQAAIIKDRQIQLLQDLIARKKIELGGELGAPEEMDRKAIEQTIKNAEDAIDDIRTGADKPAAAPAEQPKQKNIGVFNYMGPVTGRASTGAPQTADLARLSRFGGPPAAAGGDGAEGDAGDGDESELPKDAPLSITKRQQDLRVGDEQRKEQHLVMQLQKIGMSQQSAQQIAKRIGQYLKQRNIPVAEGMAAVEKVLLDEKKSDSNKRKIAKRKTIQYMNSVAKKIKSNDDDARKAASSFILAIQNIAKEQNPDKFKAFLKKNVSAHSRPPTKAINLLSNNDIKDLMKYSLNNKDFRKLSKKGFKARQKQRDDKAERRSDIRSGKEQNVMAKIMARFVSDNQKLLDKDPALKAIFDDPQKFNKLRKSVTSFIRRQFKRRGYTEEEYSKLLQEAFRHELKKMLLEE